MQARWVDRGLCGALLLFVAGRCLVPMDETDLFFNLRLGEIVLATRAVPGTNLLSFTSGDFPETNLAWIFQVVLALAHRAGGIPGTVVLKTAFVLATVGVLWRVGRARGAGAAWLAPALALACWAAEPRFVERPHLVTFLGLGLVLLAIERAEAGRTRGLWALVPAGIVWANANSCFFLAPAVLLLYAAGAVVDGRRADARRAALVAAALLPLTLATPAGARAWLYIANHLRMPWLRPLQEYRTAEWPVDGPFFFVVALLAVTAAAAGRGRARTILPAAALAVLGARRIRFVAEASLLAAPTIAALASAWARRRWGAAGQPGIAARLAVIGGLVALAVVPRVADARAGERWFDVDEQRDLVPRAAIAFATQHGLRQRMYNDLEVGSYLTWEGWPRYRVFQDPRINSYPDEFHAQLRRADLTRAEWQAILDRHGVTSAMISYPGVNPRSALFDPARWALIHRTGEALIFARRLPAFAALIAAEEIPLSFHYAAATGAVPVPIETPPAGTPVAACEWSRRLGDFFIVAGDRRAAFAAYRAALTATACVVDPARREGAQRSLAALALERDDPETAAAAYAALPGAAGHAGRGFALMKMRRADQALMEFDAALAQPPADPDALLGRALALEATGRPPADVSAALRDFLARAPSHPAAPDALSRLARIAAPP